MKKLLMFLFSCCSLSSLYSLPNSSPLSVDSILLALVHQNIAGICPDSKDRLIRAAIKVVTHIESDSLITDKREQLSWRFVAALKTLEAEQRQLKNALLTLNDIPSSHTYRRKSEASELQKKQIELNLALTENEYLRCIIATAANQFCHPSTHR